MEKHGIAIRQKKTKKLVKFYECEVDRALRILSGVRYNLDTKNYTANEEFVKDTELTELK